MTAEHDIKSYDEQLARVSAALAAARGIAVLGDITANCGLRDVQRFVDNAVGERFRLLAEELAFVALAFDDFEQLIDQYLRETPRQTYALDASDQECFLAWLRRMRALNDKQSDFVASQEAEYACLAKARENRQSHVAFQRIWTLSKQAKREQQELPNQELRVNPIHVWSRLTVVGGEANQRGEGSVLFLAVGREVRSLWPARQHFAAVRDLTANNPTTLAAWSARNQKLNHPEQLCEELIASGLVALA